MKVSVQALFIRTNIMLILFGTHCCVMC